jgi:ribosome-binding factor A
LHEKIIKALNKAVPSFRHHLSKQVTLRVVPDITFILDKTQEKALAIESLIDSESANRKPKKNTSRKKK